MPVNLNYSYSSGLVSIYCPFVRVTVNSDYMCSGLDSMHSPHERVQSISIIEPLSLGMDEIVLSIRTSRSTMILNDLLAWDQYKASHVKGPQSIPIIHASLAWNGRIVPVSRNSGRFYSYSSSGLNWEYKD